MYPTVSCTSILHAVAVEGCARRIGPPMAQTREHPITVSIVEDDPVLLDGLNFCLNQSPSTEVIGRYASGAQALEGLAGKQSEVTLIDIGLPDISGIEVIQALHGKVDTQFLIFSVYDDDQHIFQALKAGAVGYILKNNTNVFTEAVKAIEEVISGGAPMSLGIARRLLAEFRAQDQKDERLENLTQRETQILDYLARGYSTRKVAQELCVSYETIRCHQKNIYKKIQVNSLIEALAVYRGERRSGRGSA